MKNACEVLRCGDVVQEPEGRHFGTVESMDGLAVKVRWLETGWYTWFPHFRNLERAGRSYLLEA